MQSIINRLRDFRDARNWRKYHTPKNLSMAIAIEAAELMECFQWLDGDEPFDTEAVLDELADVMIYCLNLADIIGCDIHQVIMDKIDKNEGKYPLTK